MPQNSPTSVPAELSDGANSSAEALSPRAQLVNWTAIFFAVLQSVCSAFIALSGVQILIGAGAFAAAAGVLRFADQMHVAPIRIPMMLLALAGAAWNLLSLWRVRSLRRRPASAWRQRPLPPAKRRSERFQLAISVLTLLLLAVEELAHHAHFSRW